MTALTTALLPGSRYGVVFLIDVLFMERMGETGPAAAEIELV
ncbi:hypothetical protein HM1_1024 [Heliomicrobium modesticaldum Ice1]|uniref:Uncharacterized protein n=1 Tax=Heliobacterium modesticaldum (strain ATCC 51547 / Ice1) TaxID=498761 RepID=B0TID0_HELMI|nr:hypothetical protein HM1_1024 [Heliomicrobium modesticaldum Ice1]